MTLYAERGFARPCAVSMRARGGNPFRKGLEDGSPVCAKRFRWSVGPSRAEQSWTTSTPVKADALRRHFRRKISKNTASISDTERNNEVKGLVTPHNPTGIVNSPCSRRPRSFPACFSGEGAILQRERRYSSALNKMEFHTSAGGKSKKGDKTIKPIER